MKNELEIRRAEEEYEDNLKEKWVDPTPNLIEGIFHVNPKTLFLYCSKNKDNVPGKIVVYDYRSLYCLHFKSVFRQELVNFTCSNFFENFIILLIFLNTVVLTIYDYNDRDNLTDWNQTLELIG